MPGKGEGGDERLEMLFPILCDFSPCSDLLLHRGRQNQFVSSSSSEHRRAVRCSFPQDQGFSISLTLFSRRCGFQNYFPNSFLFHYFEFLNFAFFCSIRVQLRGWFENQGIPLLFVVSLLVITSAPINTMFLNPGSGFLFFIFYLLCS